jgi:hypothetical protein
MRGRALLMLLAGLTVAAATSGCAQLEETRRYLTMNDRVDGTEEDNDEWAVVRKEGRGDRPPEVEADGWFDRWFHSAKYNEINRNLGYISK